MLREVTLEDYEYERGGSANVFCAVQPKAGVYSNKVTESRDGLNQAEIAIGTYSR